MSTIPRQNVVPNYPPPKPDQQANVTYIPYGFSIDFLEILLMVLEADFWIRRLETCLKHCNWLFRIHIACTAFTCIYHPQTTKLKKTTWISSHHPHRVEERKRCFNSSYFIGTHFLFGRINKGPTCGKGGQKPNGSPGNLRGSTGFGGRNNIQKNGTFSMWTPFRSEWSFWRPLVLAIKSSMTCVAVVSFFGHRKRSHASRHNLLLLSAYVSSNQNSGREHGNLNWVI